MIYNSANDELFIADWENGVVSAICLTDTSNLHEVYRVPNGKVFSVCHIQSSDSLLVCSSEHNKRWLVALSRNGSKWIECQRVEISEVTGNRSMSSGTLSDSRVLVGAFDSTYMELFRVEKGHCILRVHRIRTEEYMLFSATCSSDTRVAMSYKTDNSVRLHRLRGDLLEELARIPLQIPNYILWLSGRILVTEGWPAVTVIELEVTSSRIERRGELKSSGEGIRVSSWCEVGDELAIFDYNSRDILFYKFNRESLFITHDKSQT